MSEAEETTARGTPAQEYPPLLTKGHMADLLDRTVRTIYRLESRGLIPSSVNVGSQRVWVRDEVLHWTSSGCPLRRVWERLHPRYRKTNRGA